MVSIPTTTKTIKSIKPASLGNPKKLLGLVETIKQLPLGIIAAEAHSVVTIPYTDPKSQAVTEYKAIRGRFFGWSYGGDDVIGEIPKRRPDIQAGVLYLPDGIDEQFHAIVNNKGTAPVVRFAFVLGTERSSNAVGYSWFSNIAIEPAAETEQHDPMLEFIAAAQALRLAAPEQELASEPVKGKGKVKA